MSIFTCMNIAMAKSLYEGLLSFIQFYNYERKHQSLAYLTPSQVYVERKSITKK